MKKFKNDKMLVVLIWSNCVTGKSFIIVSNGSQ